MKFIITIIFLVFALVGSSQELIQVGQNITGEYQLNTFNYLSSLAINGPGNIVALGVSGYDEIEQGGGSVVIKKYNPETETWQLFGNALYGTEAGQSFGKSVELSYDGLTIAIGSDSSPQSNYIGQIEVFDFNGTEWVQRGEPMYGNDMGDSPVSWDGTGREISISGNGNVVAIGADQDSINDISAGRVDVYGWDGTEWVQLGSSFYGDQFGQDVGEGVSLNYEGDRLAFGATGYDYEGNSSAGFVKVFDWNGTSWEIVGEPILGADGERLSPELFLSNSGDEIAFGSRLDNPNEESIGAIRVMKWNGEEWINKGSPLFGADFQAHIGYHNMFDFSGDGNFIALGYREPQIGPPNPKKISIYQWVNDSWTFLDDYHDDGINADIFRVNINDNGKYVFFEDSYGGIDTYPHGKVMELEGVLEITEEFEQFKSPFQIYPNYFDQSSITPIQFSEEIERIEIYSNLGALIESTSNVSSSAYSINKGLGAGIYLVKVQTKSGGIYTSKIVINF